MAVKNRLDLTNHPNSLVLELSIARKKVFFILVYRKFGQTLMEFNNFIEKFETLISKIEQERPHCTIITGDFNAHCHEWYSGDKTDIYGSTLQNLFNNHIIFQLVNQATFITKMPIPVLI